MPSVGNRVGVTEPFLMHMAHGGPMHTSNRFQDNKRGLVGINKNTASNEQTLRVCRRFYVALILSSLVQESPVVEVCESCKVARVMVQALQEKCGKIHDELILEADASVIKEAALLLQMSMERAASLLVPLHVKLKVGRTWGSLEPFTVEQPADGS